MCHGLYLQVDLIKLSTLPVLKRFLGTDEFLELKVSEKLMYHVFVKLNMDKF